MAKDARAAGFAGLCPLLLVLAGCAVPVEGPSTPPPCQEVPVRSDVASGTYNVAQRVTLAAPCGGGVLVAVDDGPFAAYDGPILVDREARLRAVPDDGAGPATPVLDLHIRILAEPTSTAGGRFVLSHPDPIRQDITRAAFLAPGPGAPGVVFSTLERPSGSPADRAFLLVRQALDGRPPGVLRVPGAVEARSYAWSPDFGSYVLGTSLPARLLRMDAGMSSVEPLFEGPDRVWVHRLAVRGEEAFTVLSAPKPVAGYAGLLRFNLTTRAQEVIPFGDGEGGQGWGGVQSVDPSGRVWFYRAYPWRLLWWDSGTGIRDRELAGVEGRIESWDTWQGAFYLVLARPDGGVAKRRVDAVSLAPSPKPPPDDPATSVFLRTLRLDLFHTDPARAYYYDPANDTLYAREGDALRLLGKLALGTFLTEVRAGEPLETPVLWRTSLFGDVELVGMEGDHALLWLHGRKTLLKRAMSTGDAAPVEVGVSNLSPAEITSLVPGPDDAVYGAGWLTTTSMFLHRPRTNATEILRGAIPHAEGQVNALFRGHDGNIYGSAYPGAVVFRFDPQRAWLPGHGSQNNPANLGPLGHGNQMRAYRGVQDLDGNVWFESTSDYAEAATTALARADFTRRTVDVVTDQADGFPDVVDLAVFDTRHLLLLTKGPSGAGLALLDQRNLTLVSSVPLPREDGVLANAGPGFAAPDAGPLLALGPEVFRVREDLTLLPWHRAAAPVVKMLPAGGGAFILVGQDSVEYVSPEGGRWEHWWRGKRPDGGDVLSPDGWRAAALLADGRLMLADNAALWSFLPPGWE